MKSVVATVKTIIQAKDNNQTPVNRFYGTLEFADGQRVTYTAGAVTVNAWCTEAGVKLPSAIGLKLGGEVRVVLPEECFIASKYITAESEEKTFMEKGVPSRKLIMRGMVTLLDPVLYADFPVGQITDIREDVDRSAAERKERQATSQVVSNPEAAL